MFSIALSFMVRELYGVIAVMDLYPQVPEDKKFAFATITQAPQLLLNELAKRKYPINDRPVLYMDEDDVWDQVLTKNGEFDNFRVLHAPTLHRAVEQLVSGGVMDRKDTLREPVVGKQLIL